MYWLKKILSACWQLPLKLKSSVALERVLFLKTAVSVPETSGVTISGATIINDRISIGGDGNVLKAVGCKITNTRIIIEGRNCQLLLREGTVINNSEIVLRGTGCIIEIGKGTTVGSGELVCMGVDNSLTIGEGCMIADNVDVWATDSHPIMDRDSRMVLNLSSPIAIADHVWIGKGASVLKGVKIGQDSVVGMKSLVTHDIEPYSLYAGIPAKKIKEYVTWDRNFIEQ